MARRNGMAPQCRRSRLPLSVLTFTPGGRARALLGASSAHVRVRDRKRPTRLVALRATGGQGSDEQSRRWHTRSACKARALLRLRLAVRCLHARFVT